MSPCPAGSSPLRRSTGRKAFSARTVQGKTFRPAAWASVTERPGSEITYTANWPHDALVGNTPASNLLIWTVFSVLFLIAGIGLLGWHYATSHGEEMVPVLPKKDPLAAIKVTPSMRATAKYFWVVLALFLLELVALSQPWRR